jgi:predicted lipid-binding transport protein (Tim44 family)
MTFYGYGCKLKINGLFVKRLSVRDTGVPIKGKHYTMLYGMADIILLAVIAGAVIVQLVRALGNTKYGQDPKPGPVEAASVEREAAEIMPPAPERSRLSPEQETEIAKEEEAFADEIKAIRKHDPRFSLRHFLDGAEAAFSMIVEAYAKGDRETLRSLTDERIFAAFGRAVDEREASGHVQETYLVKIAQVICKTIAVEKATARITVSYVSEQISHVKDASGQTVSGHPSRIHNVHDAWTFERNLRRADPSWRLVSATTETKAA